MFKHILWGWRSIFACKMNHLRSGCDIITFYKMNFINEPITYSEDKKIINGGILVQNQQQRHKNSVNGHCSSIFIVDSEQIFAHREAKEFEKNRNRVETVDLVQVNMEILCGRSALEI